jgi:hypothetical protein
MFSGRLVLSLGVFNDRFLEKIQYAARVAGIGEPIATLDRWSKAIERDFTKRNFHAMPFYKVVEISDGTVFECDTRPLSTQLNELRTCVNSLECHQLAVEQKVATSIQKMNTLRDEMNCLGDQLRRIETLMNKLVGCQQNKDHGAQANDIVDDTTPPSNIDHGAMTLQHNNIAGHLQLPLSLKRVHPKDLFVDWHEKGYYASQRRDNKNSKQIYNNARFCVEYFQLFLDEQVLPLPPGVTYGSCPEAKEWRDHLKMLTDHAWTNYEELYGRKCKGKGLQECVSTFKEWMFKLDWEEWPPGPKDASHFNLRTKEFLIQNQIAQREKQKRNRNKRARVDDGGKNHGDVAETEANNDEEEMNTSHE